MLGFLHIVTHLLLAKRSEIGALSLSHVTAEEREMEKRFRDLPKITQRASGRNGIQILTHHKLAQHCPIEHSTMINILYLALFHVVATRHTHSYWTFEMWSVPLLWLILFYLNEFTFKLPPMDSGYSVGQHSSGACVLCCKASVAPLGHFILSEWGHIRPQLSYYWFCFSGEHCLIHTWSMKLQYHR